MNLQILIFSILLILAYGYYALADKHIAAVKLRAHHVAYQRNFRQMLNHFQSDIYKHLEEAPRHPTSPSTTRSAREPQEEEEKEDFSINRACARLNLWPLVQKGKEGHPCLYELFAKLIRTFYGSLNKAARFEYQFLEAWLQAAGHLETSQGLENARFPNPDFQAIYYKMLKGAAGLPPLLEYVKMEPSADKICVFHANQRQLSLLFQQNIAEKLHTAIHSKEGPRLSAELIERIALDCRVLRLDPNLMALLEVSYYFKHRDQKQYFQERGENGSLRKRLIMEVPK